jgi:threonylcarbamoyladenosine tRNA methylthiotransferase MtaB
MKTVSLHNLGCKVNGYETDGMEQMLQLNGYKVVPFDDKADVYIINTCSVTNIADRKSRQMLHRARALNPDAIVVAVGCYVQTGLTQLKADPEVDIAVGNNRKKDIVSLIDKYEEQRKAGNTSQLIAVEDIGEDHSFESMHLSEQGEHTRAYLKIQDGCNQFCTYCIIPYARGRIRSREADDVVEEAGRLCDAGCREIVLTGIHISSYGMDKGEQRYWGESLISLIDRIADETGITRIRLGSLEPRLISPEFVNAAADQPALCPHFHLALQSGCDRTLKRMNRHYTTDEFAQGVRLLRAAYVHPAITTDVIVGFPGETEEDYTVSKEFAHSMNFYEMHVFQYSRRKGTPAAEMPDQIPHDISARRSADLIAMGNEMSYLYRSEEIGKNVEVLFEEERMIGGKKYCVGHTREYVLCAAERSKLAGQLIKGKPDGFLADDILHVMI